MFNLFSLVDDVNYLEGDLVTLAGWGSYYNVRNELVDKNPTLKLINLRVSQIQIAILFQSLILFQVRLLDTAYHTEN